nr:hypothetical protein CFP56_65494 [Quercus suber]
MSDTGVRLERAVIAVRPLIAHAARASRQQHRRPGLADLHALTLEGDGMLRLMCLIKAACGIVRNQDQVRIRIHSRLGKGSAPDEESCAYEL